MSELDKQPNFHPTELMFKAWNALPKSVRALTIPALLLLAGCKDYPINITPEGMDGDTLNDTTSEPVIMSAESPARPTPTLESNVAAKDAGILHEITVQPGQTLLGALQNTEWGDPSTLHFSPSLDLAINNPQGKTEVVIDGDNGNGAHALRGILHLYRENSETENPNSRVQDLLAPFSNLEIGSQIQFGRADQISIEVNPSLESYTSARVNTDVNGVRTLLLEQFSKSTNSDGKPFIKQTYATAVQNGDNQWTLESSGTYSWDFHPLEPITNE